jgi:transcriptional regulator with XRE-family HTH domain
MQLKDPGVLQALMKSKNVSGRQVSEAAGWRSHTHLQRLLRGEVNTLKPEPALAIAQFLGVPLDVLFVTRVARKTGRTEQDNRRRKLSA